MLKSKSVCSIASLVSILSFTACCPTFDRHSALETVTLGADDIRVDCGLKSGSSDGKSWENAFRALDESVLGKVRQDYTGVRTIALKGTCITASILALGREDSNGNRVKPVGNLHIV